MTAVIIPHPASVLAQLRAARLHWMREAARFAAKDDRNNAAYCQGRASGLDDAILALGGEGVSLRIGDYAEGAV